MVVIQDLLKKNDEELLAYFKHFGGEMSIIDDTVLDVDQFLQMMRVELEKISVSEIREEQLKRLIDDVSMKVLDVALDVNDSVVLDGIDWYLLNIKKPLLSFEEERELGYRILNGDDLARDELVVRNLGLVISIAKKFRGFGNSFLDLIQDGNEGLIMAASKYDVTKGYRFSTYAVWWIRYYIVRSIANTSRNVRIPVYLFDKIYHFKRKWGELQQKLGRVPTIKELAEYTGISYDDASFMVQYFDDTVSLNDFATNEEDTSFLEFVPDCGESIEEIYCREEFSKLILDFLENSKMSDRSKLILKYRMGFFDEKPYTLKEISSLFGISSERVRQIEVEALKMLRLQAGVMNFIDYLDSPSKGRKYILKSKR